MGRNCEKHGNGAPPVSSRGALSCHVVVPAGASQVHGRADGESASAVVAVKFVVAAMRSRCAVKLPPNSVGNIRSASKYCFAIAQYGATIERCTYAYGYVPAGFPVLSVLSSKPSIL